MPSSNIQYLFPIYYMTTWYQLVYSLPQTLEIDALINSILQITKLILWEVKLPNVGKLRDARVGMETHSPILLSLHDHAEHFSVCELSVVKPWILHLSYHYYIVLAKMCSLSTCEG